MKKLSLLFLMLAVSLTTLAGTKAGTPSRLTDDEVWGDLYYIYQRTAGGSAVNPVSHKGFVPQEGIVEILTLDGGYYYYIKNIVYGSEREFGDYWVEGYGDQEGGFYVPLDQVVYQTRGRKAVLAWGTVSYNASTGQATFTRDASVTGVTYSMDGNTIHVEGTSGPVGVDAQDDVSYDATGLGIVWEDEEASGEETDDYEWTGYCEWGTGLDADPYVIDWQPEGEVKTYDRTSDCIHFTPSDSKFSTATTFSNEKLSGKGEIVFDPDGETVYFKDPLLSMSNGTWMRGTLSDDGTKITVNLHQYLYYDNSAGQFDYCIVNLGDCYISSYADHYLYINGGWGYNQVTYSIDGNTITLDNTNADLSAPYPNNFTASGLYGYDSSVGIGVIEANIVYTLDTDDPTTKTSAPTINGYNGENTNAYFVEILPTEPSTIYYRVKFPNRDYSNWSEYIDVLSFTASGSYLIEAYAKADGKLPSDTVEHSFTVTPVTSISELTDGKQVIGTRYYSVMGQEIPQPDGMTIVVTTYSDGSCTAVKVVK